MIRGIDIVRNVIPRNSMMSMSVITVVTQLGVCKSDCRCKKLFQCMVWVLVERSSNAWFTLKVFGMHPYPELLDGGRVRNQYLLLSRATF